MKQSNTQITPNPLTHTADEWKKQRQMLITIRGGQLGSKIDLDSSRTEFIIGRSNESDLVLTDDTVSWLHCKLRREDMGWVLEDTKSTNGTYVDTKKVSPAGHILHNGDCFKVGSFIFKYLSTSEVEASYYEEIYRLAVCDGLTQLPNRRVFEESMEKEFARAQRHKRPLALVIFDLDKFKNINDTYGHLCGDMALRAVSDTFRARVRKEDLFARYAGDEFVWLLTEANIQQAMILANWMVESCRLIRLSFRQQLIPLSISVGVAEYHPTMQKQSDLLAAADAALYRAKGAGRNCASV